MLYFSLIMLTLAGAAYFRGPVLTRMSALWFFISWLPGELPWLFALIQVIGTCVFVLLSDTFGSREIFTIAIAAFSFVIWCRLHSKTKRAAPVLNAALRKELGENFESSLPKNSQIASPSVIQNFNWLIPFRYRRKNIERLENIFYGDAERNKLDIYRSLDASQKKSSRPVLLHIHGGAWMVGHKHQQAQPLINYLAQNGWICVDINYRLAPRNRYPDCLIDVKKAIVWIKQNIENYGGDPHFIAITGGSAGGHLAALAALTANNHELQPGFEASDTQVQAAVPIYGVYDFTSHHHNSVTRRFLEKYVMPKTFSEAPDVWKSASPLFQIGDVNLPIFVIHGDKDCVVPVQQAQDFVHALKQKNSASVVYAELPGAQHGFDIFHSVRTDYHIEAVGKFLHCCYANAKQTSSCQDKNKIPDT